MESTQAAPQAMRTAPLTRGWAGRMSQAALPAGGLLWLTATLVTAHASVLGNSGSPDVALAAAAFALPNLIAAGLVAGAAVALLATTWRLPVEEPDAPPVVRRLASGVTAGTVLGGICAGLIVYAYGGYPRVTALAVTVGVSALIGGAGAALPRPVLSAGVLSCLGVLVVGLVAGFAQPGLVGLLGADGTLDAEVKAGWTAAYLAGAVGGLAAGLLAYWLLRRHGSRPWPWYLLAGALPGLLLLVTELLTRTGGAGLLALVRDLSEGDRYAVEFTAFARLRNALVVLFVGGLTAMIAIGRTLGPAAPAEPQEATPDAESPDA